MFALFAETGLELPVSTFSMPWYVTAAGWFIVLGANVVILFMVRRADIRRMNVETGIKVKAAERDGKAMERREQTEEWQGLINELKLQAKERKKEHERDIRRMEREMAALHDRTTELERQSADSQRREQECQESLREIREELDTYRKTQRPNP